MENKENKPFLNINWLRLTTTAVITFVFIYLIFALGNNSLSLPSWDNVNRGFYLFISSLLTFAFYLISYEIIIKFIKIYLTTLTIIFTISVFITWGEVLEISKWSDDLKSFMVIFPLLITAFIMVITSDNVICDCNEDDYYY